jgi:hypothetical protein
MGTYWRPGHVWGSWGDCRAVADEVEENIRCQTQRSVTITSHNHLLALPKHQRAHEKYKDTLDNFRSR